MKVGFRIPRRLDSESNLNFSDTKKRLLFIGVFWYTNFMNQDNLKLIKSLKWSDVFSIWEINEASDQGWILHATKNRGFPSWQAWRQSYASKFGLSDLHWNLYEIIDSAVLSTFHAGPYGAWAKYYDNKNSLPFNKLIKHSAVQANKRLQKMIRNFPDEMNLIGVRKPSGIIVIIEGTHRCLAFTYLQINKVISKLEVKIALADYPKEKIPLVSKI